MIKGYWNGEHTATFIGVTYEVAQSENPTHWQNQFVGKIRQGIQITYAGETWIIDNEHGDGYYKVTAGQGSPRCGHKSIDNPINVQPIDDNAINRVYDAAALQLEHEEHDKFMEENHPETYKKIQALKAVIEKNKTKFGVPTS